jgi:hypothetical protein
MNIITPIMSPNVILERLKTVDGAGSGLDADLLDGREGSGYIRTNKVSECYYKTLTATTTYNNEKIIDGFDVGMFGLIKFVLEVNILTPFLAAAGSVTSTVDIRDSGTSYSYLYLYPSMLSAGQFKITYIGSNTNVKIRSTVGNAISGSYRVSVTAWDLTDS